MSKQKPMLIGLSIGILMAGAAWAQSSSPPPSDSGTPPVTSAPGSDSNIHKDRGITGSGNGGVPNGTGGTAAGNGGNDGVSPPPGSGGSNTGNAGTGSNGGGG